MVTNNIEEYKGVYVFAQQVDNEISGIALELLGKGKELAAKLETEVTAVLIGYNVKNLADKLAEYGGLCGRPGQGIAGRHRAGRCRWAAL